MSRKNTSGKHENVTFMLQNTLQIHVTEYVERKVSYKFLEKFATFSDGWAVVSGYIVIFYASYPSKSEKDCDQVLLSFSTFEYETSHISDERKKYTYHELSCYK